MPGPALTVSVNGDTSGLDSALAASTSSGGLAGFATSVGDLVNKLGGIEQVSQIAGAALGKLIEIGGPEAQAAIGKLQESLGTALAPVLEKLAPLIVKLIEGLSALLVAVLPVLIPLLEGLATVLGLVFDGVGFVLEVVGKFVTAISDLMSTALNPLWTLLDSVRGMFDLVGQAVDFLRGLIQPLIDAINTILGPIGDLLNTVGGLIGDLGEALGLTQDVVAAGTGLGGGRRSGGYFGPGAQSMGYGSIVVNTGADPSATVRAIRRYSAANGGARSFSRNATGIRGH